MFEVLPRLVDDSSPKPGIDRPGRIAGACSAADQGVSSTVSPALRTWSGVAERIAWQRRSVQSVRVNPKLLSLPFMPLNASLAVPRAIVICVLLSTIRTPMMRAVIGAALGVWWS
jgi:hypothetical protein